MDPLPFEPFRAKVIEALPILSKEERLEAARLAEFNLFQLPAQSVTFDLLTDSGVVAMSSKQWAEGLSTPEAYAFSEGYQKLKAKAESLTGMKYTFPLHQGRAAERILYSALCTKGQRTLSNGHFDTTRGVLNSLGVEAIDIPMFDKDPTSGNLDLSKLESKNIAAIILTATNNTYGGLPISLENVKAVSEFSKSHRIPLVIDGCRIAENSALLYESDSSLRAFTPLEICRKMIGFADYFYMSAKKDGLCAQGAMLCTSQDSMVESLRKSIITSQGFYSYGGMSSRDMASFAQGLDEVVELNYLKHRLLAAREFGAQLHKYGVKLVDPVAPHAIYLDLTPDYFHLEYPAYSFSIELYLNFGIRSLAFGKLFHPQMGKEWIRLALPRRVYSSSHLAYIAKSISELWNDKERVRSWRPKSKQEPARQSTHYLCGFTH